MPSSIPILFESLAVAVGSLLIRLFIGMNVDVVALFISVSLSILTRGRSAFIQMVTDKSVSEAMGILSLPCTLPCKSLTHTGYRGNESYTGGINRVTGAGGG
jgi:hypothetical protein